MIVLAAARAAASNDRLAVLVVVEGDPALSDNLTEVAISRLAQRRDSLLVGLREVRDSLGDILVEPGIGACVEQPACLARLGAATRAESALIGDVRRESAQFVVRLFLVNTQTAAREAEFTTTVPDDMKQLIASIRTGVVSLFEPKTAPPVASAPPQPPPPLPGLRENATPPPPVLLPGEAKPAARNRWLTLVGYGAGGMAVVALSAAVVTGIEATGTPTGADRPETERDLGRREGYATVANALFIAAGALALTACAAFLWRSHHD
jgi:hypothetical protein